MALEITESVLEQAQALNASGDVAGAYQVLAEAGDNYSQNALVVIEEINDPESIFARIVQTHWDRVAPGARQTHFMAVGALHQRQYLQLVRNEPRGLTQDGEQRYLLPNSIEIENSYRTALVNSGLPAVTTVDSMFSLIDRYLETSNEFPYAQIRGAGVVDMTWAKMLNPELDAARIRFDSDVFLNDNIEPIQETLLTVAQLFLNAGSEADYGYIEAAEALYALLKDAFGDLKPQLLGLEEPQAISLSAALMVAVDAGMSDEKMMRLLDASTLGDTTGVRGQIRNLEWITRNLQKAMTGADPGAFPDREALYRAAGALLNSISTGSGADNQMVDLTRQSAQELESLAAQDDVLGRAYRYALVNLQPFALLQQSGQAPAPDALNEDYDLDQFSEQYLHDRSLFLYTLNQFYLTDASVDADRIIEFKDEATDQFVATQRSDDHVSQRYFFGDDHEDNFTGGEDHDHFYGGDGDDTLSGVAGNDYLEGNEGSDTLDGGEGDDELHGDSGIDILYVDNNYFDETTGLYKLEDDGESDRLASDYAITSHFMEVCICEFVNSDVKLRCL